MNASKMDLNKPVAVIGAGLVGAGWAIAFARAGLHVRIYDANPHTAEKALPWAAHQLAALHGHGLLDEAPETVAARLTLADSLAQAIDGAAYVQESVLERVDVKRQLMLNLEQVADDSVIIGSSSSGIKASDFANDLAISPRVLIAHPVNPPYLVPVVELVPSTQTSPQTIAFADALMRGIGQSVVHVRKEIEGFVLNRLQAALLREAWALQRDGIASCEDIDKTVRDGLGWRWSFMGPFETIDLNAPGGVADYANRLGPLYDSIARSRSEDGPWDDALIARVEADRRRHLSASELAARRDWRDEQLMQFAASRTKGGVR
ncbi:3-hydroxybutyryl-CoA dehydrogenase [Burkholderia sp. SFA1]|uniref:3-hydroxyacyl-CoA dehydrogenase n=1 Tax=Caballeronia sp. CLC5 TaxID=2906764 RepID=UPI001F2FF2D4|nr:3-hydroxyacyl-CoA dehydrogenase [Caballeronia sp. CLC5]MCE4574593.1 3-hydroxyacyl-CoA dehydrogenase [Caballeronia sp. CLC5]BBP99974.1 3-hydroxybutyryl-CoA dehydrogenase [Burkholderia sp. SFA1]